MSESHQAVFSVAVVATVEKPERDASFRESVREGRRKKIFENPEPEHYFHLEYQLLPESAGCSQLFKTDVVSFGVVSKIYTEKDTRVVQCWEEGDRLTSFGWRHKHTVKVNKALLLELYNHTLELRIWNTKSKVSARARYDRPKAFRLPASSKSHHEELGNSPLTKKPSKLCVVSHEQAKTTGGRRRGKQWSSLSLHADTDSETSVIEQPLSPALSPRQLEPVIPEEELTQEPSGSNILQLVPSAVPEAGSSASRRKPVDTEEPTRAEREGLTVLRLKTSHLFAKGSTSSATIAAPAKNLRGLEVCVSVQENLMSPELLRELNPLTITVARLTGLPSSPLTHLTLQQDCEPVFVRYKFPGHAPHQTPGLAAAGCLEWQDAHTVLLGTVPRDELLEFLRGPPLAMELHDRQPKTLHPLPPAVFGQETNDHSIGTHALGTRLSDADGGAVVGCRAPYGIASVDLTGFLAGQKIIEVSAPVVSGPKLVGVATTPPGNYLESQCELVVKAELAHPLFSFLPLPSSSKRSKSITTTFNRLVYVISKKGKPLTERVLGLVNEINAKVLQLDHLPATLLPCALSTYKLTREELSRDVITGFHVQDSEMAVLVLEGLRGEAVHQLWSGLPRHPSQEPGLVKCFYNSQFAFCERLYGSLDVDLPCIFLYQPLSRLLKNSMLYVSGALPPHCFRALMCLSELALVEEMADLARTDLLPSAQEVAALSLHFGLPPTHQPTHNQSPAPAHTASPDHTPTHEKRVWQPLELTNPLYEKHLKDRQTKNHDFLHKNILRVAELSKQSSISRPRRQHSRSLSDSQQHVYSSQTFNANRLEGARLQNCLDPRRRYTYCQTYHSMTLEPGTINNMGEEEEEPASCSEGFKYPGVASALESNRHRDRPHPGRLQSLNEPFQDNLLHANTLKPSVDRLHFSWEERSKDFERYKAPPLAPSLPPPSSIHLAGQSRARELLSSTALEEEQWRERVVVADTRFHVHRQGVRAELATSGPRASTQLDRLKDILKDKPEKHSLKGKGFKLEAIPVLSMGQGGASNSSRVMEAGDGKEDCSVQGYLPGPSSTRSLRLDSNVIPITKPVGALKTHSGNFRAPCQDRTLVL